MLRLRVAEDYWKQANTLVSKTASITGSPAELGMFWIKDGKMYKASVPWDSDELSLVGDQKSYDLNPEKRWGEVVAANPELKGLVYSELDHGKVDYVDGKFRVILAQNLKRDTGVQNLVIQNFNLPKGQVSFEADSDMVGKPTFQTRRRLHDQQRGIPGK